MNVLYLKRKVSDVSSGDEILDQKLISIIRKLVNKLRVVEISPKKKIVLTSFFSARQSLLESQYYSNVFIEDADLIIVSHEHLAKHAVELHKHFSNIWFIIHNNPSQAVFLDISSSAEQAILNFNNNINEAAVLANKIFVISEREKIFFQKLNQSTHLLLLGPSGCISDWYSRVNKTPLLIGTYNWRLKKNSLDYFLSEYNGPVGNIINDRELQFLINIDRFDTGIKLKVIEAICRNCVVISLLDLSDSFVSELEMDQILIKVDGFGAITKKIENIIHDMDENKLRKQFSDFSRLYRWENTESVIKKCLSEI